MLSVIPLTMAQIYIATKCPSFMADYEMPTCFLNNAIWIMPCFDAILTMLLIAPYRNAIVTWLKWGYEKSKEILLPARLNRVTCY